MFIECHQKRNTSLHFKNDVRSTTTIHSSVLRRASCPAKRGEKEALNLNASRFRYSRIDKEKGKMNEKLRRYERVNDLAKDH